MKIYEKSLKIQKIYDNISKVGTIIVKILLSIMILSIIISIASANKPILPRTLGIFYSMINPDWQSMEKGVGLMLLLTTAIPIIYVCIGTMLLMTVGNIYRLSNNKYFKYSTDTINSYLKWKNEGSKNIVSDLIRSTLSIEKQKMHDILEMSEKGKQNKEEIIKKVYDFIDDSNLIELKKQYSTFKEIEEKYDVDIEK